MNEDAGGDRSARAGRSVHLTPLAMRERAGAAPARRRQRHPSFGAREGRIEAKQATIGS